MGVFFAHCSLCAAVFLSLAASFSLTLPFKPRLPRAASPPFFPGDHDVHVGSAARATSRVRYAPGTRQAVTCSLDELRIAQREKGIVGDVCYDNGELASCVIDVVLLGVDNSHGVLFPFCLGEWCRTLPAVKSKAVQ